MWMGKLYELINDKPKAIYHYERLVVFGMWARYCFWEQYWVN